MRQILRHALGPGRTVVRRVAPGLAVAATIAFALVPLPLFVVALSSDLAVAPKSADQLEAAFSLLGASFLAAMAIVAPVGALIWGILRGLKQESGRAYLLSGVVAGGVLTGQLLVARAPVSLWLYGGAAGLAVSATASLSFWLVAREPRESQTDRPAP